MVQTQGGTGPHQGGAPPSEGDVLVHRGDRLVVYHRHRASHAAEELLHRQESLRGHRFELPCPLANIWRFDGVNGHLNRSAKVFKIDD